MNPYDGKSFEITTPDSTKIGAGYLAPSDGSLPPARIAGAEEGSRYDLDPKNTGNSDDYVEGPFVGPEIREFIAKRGGQVGRMNGGDVAPWPAWTLQQYLAPLVGSVHGGPNATAWGGKPPVVLTPEPAPVLPPKAAPMPTFPQQGNGTTIGEHQATMSKLRTLLSGASAEVHMLVNYLEHLFKK